MTIRQTPKGHRLDITKLYAYKAKGQVVYWGLDKDDADLRRRGPGGTPASSRGCEAGRPERRATRA